jgi:hypothetical protein
MEKHESVVSCLFTSEELATHIVDTLVDHGFIEKARLKEAVASVKWELDAQHGIGRIALNPEEGQT